MADDPASQLSLPVELITFVTDEISPSDLLNLRLACRDTAAKTHDVFLRVHFEDKCFMGSHKPSMDTLLRISETKEFAQSIKRLWFFSSRLTILKNQQSTEIAIRKQLTAQPSGMARRSQTNLYKPPYEALKGQEKAFVGESRIQLLTQTFENFQKAGSAPDIKCAGAELTYATTPNGGRRIRTLYDLLDKLKPWVYQTLNGLFGHPRHSTLERPWSMSGQNHSESQHRWYDHAHIYEAIVDSRFATRTLELGDCNVPLSLREFNYKEGTFNLPSLRSLKLAVCVPRGKDMDWDTAFAHTGLRALARFLACAQKLQHLALSVSIDTRHGHGPDSCQLFDRIATMTYLDEHRLTLGRTHRCSRCSNLSNWYTPGTSNSIHCFHSCATARTR